MQVGLLCYLDKHAGAVCRCDQLNREKGVERVEDPSRSPEAEPLVGFKGRSPLRILPLVGRVVEVGVVLPEHLLAQLPADTHASRFVMLLG